MCGSPGSSERTDEGARTECTGAVCGEIGTKKKFVVGTSTVCPPVFHMFSTVSPKPKAEADRLTFREVTTTLRHSMLQQLRALAARIRTPLAAVIFTVVVPAAASAEAVLYRIYLTDGSTLVSYGEFARVAGRVVFSMPIGGTANTAPDLQLVTLADGAVDWERTERYAESVRANRYAETRGEEDFKRLSAEIARTLSAISVTKDPVKRLAIADAARKMLSDWPSRNYGYRAQDVVQLTALLDEVVSELRVAAGQSRFDLNLVATTTTPPPVALLPAPAFRESIEQAFTAARLTPEPIERISLLSAVVQVLGASRDETWAAALHARASADLSQEVRTEKSYADLTAQTLLAAEDRLKRADVRGLEALVKKVLAADDRLGRRRPLTTSALLATLDARVAEARRVRLARDSWAIRQQVVQSYQASIKPAMDQFRRSVPGLEEIRQLAGPSSDTLGKLSDRVKRGAHDLTRMRPATDFQPVHGMLLSAFNMASQAIATRQTAIRTMNMETAWQAASAAAGALLMFERANEDLGQLAKPPQL